MRQNNTENLRANEKVGLKKFYAEIPAARWETPEDMAAYRLFSIRSLRYVHGYLLSP